MNIIWTKEDWARELAPKKLEKVKEFCAINDPDEPDRTERDYDRDFNGIKDN